MFFAVANAPFHTIPLPLFFLIQRSCKCQVLFPHWVGKYISHHCEKVIFLPRGKWNSHQVLLRKTGNNFVRGHSHVLGCRFSIMFVRVIVIRGLTARPNVGITCSVGGSPSCPVNALVRVSSLERKI